MSGLQKICKMCGRFEIIGREGKSVIWLWDYKNDKPRLKSEMTKEDIRESEKAKTSQMLSQNRIK